MDPLQHSSTTLFRKLRISAGFMQRDFASSLGISLPTAARLDRGKQPISWWTLVRLAELCKKTPGELAEQFYSRKLGDPCACGCGGVYCPPALSHAQCLYVEIPCADCGKKRTWRESERHSKRCSACAGKNKSVERLTLKCRGDVVCGKRHFAKNCAGEVARRRSEWTKNASVNEAEKTYCCNACAASTRSYRMRERQLRKFFKDNRRDFLSSQDARKNFFDLTGFHPPKPFPKIRSVAQLSTLQRAFMKLGYQAGHVKSRKKRLIGELFHKTHSKAMLLRWSKAGCVSYVRGYCELCSKIVLSGWPGAKVHSQCRTAWLAASGKGVGTPLPPRKNRRGPHQSELESLRKHFAWAIRHTLGDESLEAIADEFRVTKQAVAKAIASVRRRMPAPELLPAHLRSRVSIFLSSIELG